MAQKGPKGIVSPWAPKPEAPKAALDLRPIWKSEGDDQAPLLDLVRFPGRMRTLLIRPLHGKGEPEAAALAALGKGLAALMMGVPETKEYFAKQSLGFTRPTATHIVLDLGGVPFYAGTATVDPETARRMAVDRIAHALTESSVKHPKAKQILAAHKIEVLNS